jgi:ABC-type Fe3+-hydroxamate transport system substrate-binding protein
MIKAMHVRGFFWLAPFLFLGLVALAPSRAPPVPAPARSHFVTDAEGVEVAVPLPFRAVAGYGGSDFLETTRAPETLLKAGGPRDRARFASGLMSRIYPRALKDDNLWNCPFDLETLLAYDNGATYFSWGPADALRRIGLPTLARGWNSANRDEQVFSAVRVEAAAMGQPERGEAFINTYMEAYADLHDALQPETLADLPRVLTMGSSVRDWSNIWAGREKDSRFDDQRVGVKNATEGLEDSGRQQDTERILAMNPDLILLYGESVQDFLHDPRWQGLKAVKGIRVYQALRTLRRSLETLYGLDYRPLWARWEAEIAHPDRLQPKVRRLVRDHYVQAYGYHLCDDEIDDLLRVDESKDSAGYARFMKNTLANKGQEASQ